MGTITATMGNYGCNTSKAESDITAWVQSMNQNGETICDGMPYVIHNDDGSVTQGHMGASSDPSVQLVPLSSSYSVWDEQSTQQNPWP